MLFRTLNRDLCLPNANADHIAPLFRCASEAVVQQQQQQPPSDGRGSAHTYRRSPPSHRPPCCRDRLMPLRSWANRSFPALLAVTRRGVEDPQSGVPGVCNFVDARTKWIDGALQQVWALGNGGGGG